MSNFYRALTVSSDAYPDRLSPQVQIPFEPDSVLIRNHGNGTVFVSFSDGIRDDEELRAGTPLQTQEVRTRAQTIWFRKATGATTQDVTIEASSDR